MSTENSDYITTGQAARILACAPVTVTRLVDNGNIPAHRVGNRRKLKRADVLAYLERCRVVPNTRSGGQ